MGRLLLAAIAINEVHEMVGAAPAVADRVRPAAERLITAEPGRRSGLLSRLRRRPEPVPEQLFTAADLDTVLAGRYPEPDRALACLCALEAMVSAQAWGTRELELTPRQMEEFDFALARAGVPSAVGLERLVESDAGIALAHAEGLKLCAIDNQQVRTAAAQLTGVRVDDQGHTQLLAALVDFLDQYLQWGTPEPSSQPDLVGFWHSD